MADCAGPCCRCAVPVRVRRGLGELPTQGEALEAPAASRAVQCSKKKTKKKTSARRWRVRCAAAPCGAKRSGSQVVGPTGSCGRDARAGDEPAGPDGESGAAAALCVQPPDPRLQRSGSTPTTESGRPDAVGDDEARALARSRLRLSGVCVRLRAHRTAVAALCALR